MQDLPGYYAVLTADVRYCKNLIPNAKLLFAEITALSNRTGECFARNEYFANLYEVDVRSIQAWKKSLYENGFIDIDRKTGNVKILQSQTMKKSSPHHEEIFTPPGRNLHPSTYSVFNNTINNYSSLDTSVEEEEKEKEKIDKMENAKCYTVEEIESRIRVQNILDEFDYKLGSVDDLRNAIAEMLVHYSEKGKSVPASLAESRVRSWLKPKYETEEDREEMRKAKKRALKRSEIMRTISHTEKEEKNYGGTLKIDFDTIPEELKSEIIEKAKRELSEDPKFRMINVSETAKKGIVRSIAVRIYKKDFLRIPVSV